MTSNPTGDPTTTGARPAAEGGEVLAVENLTVDFPTPEGGSVPAVRGVDLRLGAGRSLGIVGESGAGKSMTALALLGLLPPGARVGGSVRFRGQELVGLDTAAMRALRGRRLAMVFQDPMTSLNPSFTVGWQVGEALRAHHPDMGGRARRERAVELLAAVGIPNPGRRVDNYPHEFSGGMRQRAVIAIAMANDPDVIVADEPTTALDVTVQAQIMAALERAREETGAAMLLVSHDLGLVAGHSDEVLIMYAGRAVEHGTVEEIFHRPRMPYTIGLLASLPRLDGARGQRLAQIPGSPPAMHALPGGCPFHPRCPVSLLECARTEPAAQPTGAGGRRAACLRAAEVPELEVAERFRAAAAPPAATSSPSPERPAATSPDQAAPTLRSEGTTRAGGGPPILAVRDLVKHYPASSGVFGARGGAVVHAVCGVSLELRAGETLGLVGESGSGKTTLSRAALNLVPATSGQVLLDGVEITGRSRRSMRPLRRDLQLVFQDPHASLDPRMTVADLVAEPLRIHRRYGSDGARRVAELLELVGLAPEHGDRYPHEFSGGQRQRIVIARALALQPRVLVLDEPVSALDVSIRAGIINLLEDLQDRLGLAYLFIAHDLSVVRHIADRVAVMYLGQVVETGPTGELFAAPAHPYTRALMSAVPVPDPAVERRRQRTILRGEVPSPTDPPSGCRFRTRCPLFAQLNDVEQARCSGEAPALATPAGGGHPAACHYADRAGAQAA